MEQKVMVSLKEKIKKKMCLFIHLQFVMLV